MARGKYKKRKSKSDSLTQKLYEIVETCYPDKAEEYKQSINECNKIINSNPFNFDKFFKNDPIYYFYIKILTQLYIYDLKALRRHKKISAEELDKKLGFTTGYPYQSLKNSFNTPTQRNVKIACRICHTIARYSHGNNLESIKINNDFFDMNEMINDSFKYAGMKPPLDLLEVDESNQSNDEALELDDELNQLNNEDLELDDVAKNPDRSTEEANNDLSVNNLDDLLFIKRKAQQIYNAKSIDEAIYITNQVLKLAEFLKENA